MKKVLEQIKYSFDNLSGEDRLKLIHQIKAKHSELRRQDCKRNYYIIYHKNGKDTSARPFTIECKLPEEFYIKMLVISKNGFVNVDIQNISKVIIKFEQ